MSMSAISYCGRCLSTFDGNPDACPNLGCGGKRPGAGWGSVLGEGDVLDRRYRVDRCLAVGGAGLTYLAREIDAQGEAVGPRVAIKVLYAARASGPFLRRLSNEAQILQELAHDNIVELLGFVHRAGHEPYLVTRFEEGGSLAQHVERHARDPRGWALEPPVAAAILRQVLLGLDVAHQRGVVHRDLKPDNVLLDALTERDGVPRIRVADFGIAKVAGGPGERLTRMGAFVGTPEYAAPEQFEGLTPTPATDVFAAGALFVFLLTGRPPFTFSHRADIASTYEELLAQLPYRIARVVPPDAAPRPEVAEALDDVISNTLRLDPDERYTIHRVLQSLGPLLPLELRAEPMHTIDLTQSRIVARPSVPPEPEAPDVPPPPPPTVQGEGPQAALPRAAEEVDTDVAPPPLPPPDLVPPPPQAGATAGADTDVRPAPSTVDTAVSAAEAGGSGPTPPPLPGEPPPPPDTVPARAVPPPDTDAAARHHAAAAARPGREPAGGEPAAAAAEPRGRRHSDATEETGPPFRPFGPEAEPEEDDHTVEAPSDAPPSSVPLTGPPSYVGMRLGQTGTTDVAPQPPAPRRRRSRRCRRRRRDRRSRRWRRRRRSPGRRPRCRPRRASPPPAAAAPPGSPGASGCRSSASPRSAWAASSSSGCCSWSGRGRRLVRRPRRRGGDPGVVVGEDPPRFTKARRLSEDDRAAVERAVRKTRPEIVDHCGEGADVTAELLVDATGKVVYAKVSPQRLGTVKPQCLRRAFERVTTPVSTEGRAEIHIAL
ncbi:MAG: serine/threonine-protein kinase [Myxococcota bacterium]